MTDNTYPNPVLGVPKEERKVVTVDIIEKDWTLLKGCDLEHGSLTATFNILVNTLANECRKRGILDFSKTAEFRELVQSVSFGGGLRDSTSRGTARKANGRANARQTSGKSHKDKTASHPSGVQSGSGSGDKSNEGQAVSGETEEAS